MRIELVEELEHGRANSFRDYLADKNFTRSGLTFWCKDIRSVGKFLLLPENREIIQSLEFIDQLYIVEIDADDSWLGEEHHLKEGTGMVTNGDYFKAVESVDETKVYIDIKSWNWRELEHLFIFDQENEIYNVFASTNRQNHIQEFYTPEVVE